MVLLRSCSFVLMWMLLVALFAKPQQTGSSASDAQGSKPSSADASPQSGATQANAAANGTFSAAVVDTVLKRVNAGFTAHSAPIVLSAFDRTRMRDYPRFAAQLQSSFSQYESFQLHFHVAQFSGQGDTGRATVEVVYEATPLSDLSPPVRKGDQLRFEFARTPQGWKITAMQPWNFFS